MCLSPLYLEFAAISGGSLPVRCTDTCRCVAGKPSAKLLAGGSFNWIFHSVLKDSDPAPPVSWISKAFRSVPLSDVEKALRFRNMIDACHSLTKGSHDLYYGAMGLAMFEAIMGVERAV